MDDVTFMRVMRAEVNPGHLLDGVSPSGQPWAELSPDPSDMRDNYPLLYGVVRGLRAQRVLEIGVHDGTSTMALLKAVSEVGGHLISIDEAEVPVAVALAKKFGMTEAWALLRGNSHVLLKKLQANGECFDAAFVDGDHSLPGVKQDVADVEQMLKPGGVLLTHDNTMMVDNVDNNKPFGQRGQPACGFLGREMVMGETIWSGLFFPFGRNLGIWRRKADMLAEIEAQLDIDRERGWWPKESAK
jgi:predicted O-methyltransferase YrrM